MEISFQPKQIIVEESKSITTGKLKIVELTDNGSSVVALVYFGDTDVFKRYTLWDEQSYEDIGQWTDNDVKARILELI